MSAKQKRIRIELASKAWTAVHQRVFERVLPSVSPAAQVVYLVLLDRIWHERPKRVAAGEADLVRWTGLDQRTVNRCLTELYCKAKVIRCVYPGKKGSRMHRPLWTIPLTRFELADGNWVPVPRILIHKYLPAFPSAILLIIILKHQHMSWRNECWPGVSRLAQYTGWSKRKVYDAVKQMANEEKWKKCHPDLPWPLEMTWRKNPHGGKSRRYSIRAVVYERRRRGTIFRLSEQSAKFFKVEQATDPTTLEFD
jgi:hypothetical protein